MPKNKEQIPTAMWTSALLIASQSFLFGFVFSCLNACLVTGDNNNGSDCYNGSDSTCPKGTMYNDINLSTFEAQLATSLTILGAWIGSLLGSGPSQQYGKRMTLLGNNTFFVVGAALSSIGNYYTLFIGRFISGLGVGIASGIPSVLLSEIATAETRGTITTIHQVMVTTGIFISGILGYGLVTYVEHGWQLIQAFAAIPAIGMILLQNYVPESPKWLLMQSNMALRPDTINKLHSMEQQQAGNGGGNATTPQYDSMTSTTSTQQGIVAAVKEHEMYSAVVKTLQPLRRPGHSIDQEIADTLADAKKEAVSQVDGADVTWGEVFSYRKGMVIGLGLMTYQALTGVNTVIFYSTTIFGLAGFSESIIGTSCVGLVNLCVTVLCSYLIDTMGRKILLLAGTYVMLFALVLLSTILVCPIDEGVQGMIAVLAVLIFIAGFALGLGAVVWTVMSEIMPTRLRVKAISLFLSVNWGSNLIIGLLTLTAIDELGGVESSMDDDEEADAQKLGVAYMYFLFSAITVTCLIFMHTLVPETKDKTLEEIMGVSDSDSSASGSAAGAVRVPLLSATAAAAGAVVEEGADDSEHGGR